MMKKSICTLLAGALVASMVTACGSSTPEATTAVATTAAASEATEAGAADADTTAAAEDQTEGGSMEGAIDVISREDGSGTRGAFIELFGVEEKDASGEKVDNTTDDAEITNSTEVMITSVAGDKQAIGYISLGSLNDTVKAVKIDGAAATVDDIKDGSYKIARPFNIVTTGKVSDVAQDFINFIFSEEGQKVVEDNGYISQGNQGAYTASGVSGKVTVAGSSSVTPVMEKLAEAYKALNSDVTVEVQQSDSTTGVTSAIEGVCDIGMASRDLKEEETSQGAQGQVIAMDGIAVVVNNDNPIDELSSEEVKSIYVGDTTDWSEIK
ncbi:MAG TPA: phosphate ABC transporter substrate-binding protein [Oribacterium sp.]|nr:phosphate ABC transporter substrate-binding protein [Oribacterium sp.]HCS67481.1 phosphate ABC transporter substrate-binding protein [Oribacterium sp.]